MTTRPDALGPDQPRVVIVGAGFGGLEAARTLAKADAEVVLFDRHNHHLFQPLLYQIATAALSPANIAAPIRKILAKQKNCEVIMSEVTEVDLEGRTVTVTDQRYAYDYLVLAAGARTNYFGNDAWSEVAPGLKNISEAIDVRSRFLLAFEQAEIETDEAARRAALTFAIVGAGPTGVELAGAMAEIARQTLRADFRHIDTNTVRVILIDAEDRVLSTFTPELSDRAKRDLEQLGVEVVLGSNVIEVQPGLLIVETPAGEERIEAANVFWAAGVRGVRLGETLGAELDRGGRVIVADDLAVPGHPEVFVVGDLAHRIDPNTEELVPGVAQGAIQMGRFAGEVIAAEVGALSRGKPTPRRGVFVYRDKGSMATIGRNRAIADIHGLRFGGYFAFLAWAFIHVLFLIGFRRRLMVMLEWMWSYLTFGRGVRLITGEDQVPKPVRPPPDPRLLPPAQKR
jgi:NADH dehydrogenase